MIRSTRTLGSIGAVCLAVAAQAFMPAGASAQESFPQKPIRLLVGFPPGGTTDVLARLVAEQLAGSLKQSVVVENQPGASGLLATSNVAKAKPDGYTLLFSSSTHAIYPELYRNVAFDPVGSFTPVGLVATTPYVLVTHPSMPVKSVSELLEYAKKHPGEINYAGSSPGTAQHLGWELLKRMSETEMQYIPYKGSSEAIPDLATGRIQAAIDNVAVMRQHIESGSVRAIAVTSSEQSNVLPGVPTISESGLAGFSAIGWFGIFAPGGTPQEVVDVVGEALQAVMRSDDVRSKLVTMGAESHSGRAEDLKTLLDSEVSTWRDIIKAANISVQ